MVSQYKSSGSEKQAVALEMVMSCRRMGSETQECGVVAVRAGCTKPLQSPRQLASDESGSQRDGSDGGWGILVVAGH